MTPDEVLSRAVEILEHDGWTQGFYCDAAESILEAESEDDRKYAAWQAYYNAPVCSMGALHRAAGLTANGEWDSNRLFAEEFGTALDVVGKATERLAAQVDTSLIENLEECGGRPFALVINHNDSPAASKEDVVLAFKRAINGKAGS
ncbi:DUF6197 family protein [Streptomyces sp. S1]|uniref:DUF6197 family protein n=1 Tax=Streptomyces sp. S1 TaxID=718288 RepID=UPI003D760D1E